MKLFDPAVLKDANAPRAFCGSELPEIAPKKVLSAFTNPETIVRDTDPGGKVVFNKSAIGAP